MVIEKVSPVMVFLKIAPLVCLTLLLTACQSPTQAQQSTISAPLMGESASLSQASTNSLNNQSPESARMKQLIENKAYITIDIRETSEANSLTIVMDSVDFINQASVANFRSNRNEIVEALLKVSHSSPLVVGPELYKKLKNYKAETPDAKLAELSNQALFDQYLEEEDRHYTLKDNSMRRDKSFLRLLIERGCSISADCAAGGLRIDLPSKS